MDSTRYQATQQELAAAFTEWDRRYREDPDRFMSELRRGVRAVLPQDS